MTKRSEHTFQFPSSQIAAAARAEASYHDARIAHWDDRAAKALVTVRATIGAKVVEHPVSSGPPQVSVDVDYGDFAAWKEYQLAFQKAAEHRQARDKYESDATLYGSQSDRIYELDSDDVRHFRMGNEKRPD